jgi:hypothetical protein
VANRGLIARRSSFALGAPVSFQVTLTNNDATTFYVFTDGTHLQDVSLPYVDLGCTLRTP